MKWQRKKKKEKKKKQEGFLIEKKNTCTIMIQTKMIQERCPKTGLCVYMAII